MLLTSDYYKYLQQFGFQIDSVDWVVFYQRCYDLPRVFRKLVNMCTTAGPAKSSLQNYSQCGLWLFWTQCTQGTQDNGSHFTSHSQTPQHLYTPSVAHGSFQRRTHALDYYPFGKKSSVHVPHAINLVCEHYRVWEIDAESRSSMFAKTFESCILSITLLQC